MEAIFPGNGIDDKSNASSIYQLIAPHREN